MKNKLSIFVVIMSILVIVVSGMSVYLTFTYTREPKTKQPVAAEPIKLPEELVGPILPRGTAEPIPEEIKATMQGKSMKEGAIVTYDDLSYLTIPHYDFNGKIVLGHLVVSAELAEEVLDIFAELLEVKYPIEKMELIDKYDADDYTSLQFNNTSSFNYRVISTGGGQLSYHAFGRAIDINPQINPYIRSNGVGTHENSREYWQRDTSKWTREIDRQAYIGNDTEIYRIFKKYGWSWGGDWSNIKDYQHFEKK